MELGIVVVWRPMLLASLQATLLLGRPLQGNTLGHVGLDVFLHRCKESHLGSRASGFVVSHLSCWNQLAICRPLGIDIEAAIVLHHRITVGSGIEMQIFITHKANGNGGSIRLLHFH